MSLQILSRFRPSGPVSERFILDMTSKVKMILGPVGGGKTVATVFDAVRRPSFMPMCNDGIVRYRRAIIGTTYGQIERNLYPTWKRWIPETGGELTQIAEWKGGGGRSATHKLEWQVPRKHGMVRVKAEYVFAAVGELSVEEFMRGLEVTDIDLYEADQLPEAVIDVGITRLGRYPANGSAPDAMPLNVRWTTQISGDLNSPDIDSWFYSKFEEDPPKRYTVYKQPSGRSPKAENLEHLPRGYYDTQVEALEKRPGGKHLIARMVDAKYAPSRAGQPVFEEYDDDTHLAGEELKPVPGIPITLGFDQGLGQPACLGFQVLPSGQHRVLLEVVPGRMSARRFAERVKLELAEVAPNHPLAEIHYADPAGFTGADKEDGEMAWAEIVAAELGIVILPAETNEIDLRITAIVDQLTHFIGPGQPAFLLSRRCKITRKGLSSHYMFEKRPDEKAQTKKPIKNFWSNPLDAMQYGFLGVAGRTGVVAGNRGKNRDHHRDRTGSAADCTVLKAPVEVG